MQKCNIRACIITPIIFIIYASISIAETHGVPNTPSLPAIDIVDMNTQNTAQKDSIHQGRQTKIIADTNSIKDPAPVTQNKGVDEKKPFNDGTENIDHILELYNPKNATDLSKNILKEQEEQKLKQKKEQEEKQANLRAIDVKNAQIAENELYYIMPSIVTRYPYSYRAVSSGMIYKHRYNSKNKHLPSWMGKADYSSYIFPSIKGNDPAIIEALIQKGADINCTTLDGTSPLMYAAYIKANRAFDYLLKNGSDPNMVNNAGEDVFAIAMKVGNNAAIELLSALGYESNNKQPILSTEINYNAE